MRPRGLRFAAAIAALALVCAAAFADRQAAEFFAGRGDQALKAKQWDEAEAQFRRSLSEDAAYLPARNGLGQALLGAGRTASGIEELRGFVADVQAAPDAPAEWKALAAKATRQLEQVDAATAALEKIVQGYHDELLGLARKWMGRDDVGAEAALRRALLVRPGSKDAVALLTKMGRPVVPPVVIFDGGSTEAFEKVRFPTWQVEDGFLIGDTRDGQFYIRTLRSFEGDFDVRVEARFLEQRTGSPYLALLACRKGDYDHYSVGVHSGDAYFLDMTAEGKAREIADVKPSNLKQSFDPMQWNTYEFRARAGEVVALINGEEFGREPRSPKRDGGFIGLVVQDARVAYRRVEVQPR